MYRCIDTSFWTDPKVRGWSVDTKLLSLYLVTNYHSHVSGIFYLNKRTAADDLGFSEKRLDEAFSILAKRGFCVWDETRQVVWVVNMLKRQGTRSPKLLKGIAEHLKTLHETPLIASFLEAYSHFDIPYRLPDDTVSIRYRNGIDTVSIGYPGFNSKNVQEQDQEQDQETPYSPPPENEGDGYSKKSKILKKKEELEQALALITLDGFRETYKPLGLDVDKCWEGFKQYVLNGGPKKPRPNPSRWVDFNLAFHDSCKGAIEKGLYQITKQKTSIREVKLT